MKICKDCVDRSARTDADDTEARHHTHAKATERPARTDADDARGSGRGRRTVVAAVLASVLLAAGCGDPSSGRARAPAAASPAAIDPVPSSPSPETAARGPVAAPALPASITPYGRAPVIPPSEVAGEVLAAADQAAPRSELSLQDCTDWIADSGTVLEPAAAQECVAMLAAAAGTCRELDCFAAQDASTVTSARADRGPADPAAATSTTATGTDPAAEPDPAGEPDPAAEPDPATTSTATGEPDPAAGTDPAGEPDPAATSTEAAGTDPAGGPEGGHPPLPAAGMVPREEPYWDYPICAGPAPWPSTCYPPSEWEVPRDLSDCWTPDVAGGVCASRKPDETPRQTRDVVEWSNWCEAWRPISCEHLLSEMKWALDYLGAHPWCVVGQYSLRVEQLHRLWRRGSRIPADIRNGYGWHRCPTVIDPGQRDDPMSRLSETGITLADQCRAVLPAGVQLETTTDRIDTPPERFGSDCDAWATWVESRPAARHWRDCDRSARLAEEWMEHHYGVSEHYFPVTC